MTDIQTVRTKLHELAEWVLDLPRSWSDLPVRASRTGDGIHVRLSHTPMPGGMERAIDTWDQNGPLGIHTQIGVRQALGPWADEIRGMREALLDAHDPYDIEPWTYLHQHLDWASQHMASDQWTFMTADIGGVHQRVQRLVAPEMETVGECPRPGCHGIVRAKTGDHGIHSRARCDTCKAEYSTDEDEYGRDVRDVGRALTVPQLTTVTTAQIEKIWAREITADHVKKWVKRGKLRALQTTPATYQLRQVNLLAHDLLERRRRRAEQSTRKTA